MYWFDPNSWGRFGGGEEVVVQSGSSSVKSGGRRGGGGDELSGGRGGFESLVGRRVSFVEEVDVKRRHGIRVEDRRPDAEGGAAENDATVHV